MKSRNIIASISACILMSFASPTWAQTDAAPIFAAAKLGNVEQLSSLIDSGGNINARDSRGATPLMWASFRGNEEAVRMLIQRGADANAKAEDNTTALHWAAFRNRGRVAELLLDAGADIDARDNHGKTPLGYAIQEQADDIRALLERHAANK